MANYKVKATCFHGGKLCKHGDVISADFGKEKQPAYLEEIKEVVEKKSSK